MKCIRCNEEAAIKITLPFPIGVEIGICNKHFKDGSVRKAIEKSLK